jgi:hypothetical protein
VGRGRERINTWLTLTGVWHGILHCSRPFVERPTFDQWNNDDVIDASGGVSPKTYPNAREAPIALFVLIIACIVVTQSGRERPANA